jgi:hypothetical protein
MRHHRRSTTFCLSRIAAIYLMYGLCRISHSQAVSHGTTYAVERAPTLIALSIDSSRSNLVQQGADNQMHATCKIHASAGTVFITAGVVGSSRDKVSDQASVHKIIGDVLSRKPDPSQVVPILSSKLIPLLSLIINTPEGLAYWKQGSAALQVVMADSESGIPFLRAVEYEVQGEAPRRTLSITQLTCPGNCPNGHKSLVVHSPGFVMTPDPVGDVEKRVMSDIRSGDKDYLGPIQTVTVSQKGVISWIHKPDFCPMIPTY